MLSPDTRDGWRYMQLKLALDDLESLKNTEFFKDSGLSITENSDGNYELAQKLGSEEMEMPGGGAGAGPATDEQMLEGMSAMFAGLRIVMTVVVPGEAIESNATQVEGNRASWIYDLDKDPQILKKLDGQDEMRLVFSGEGLDL